MSIIILLLVLSIPQVVNSDLDLRLGNSKSQFKAEGLSDIELV